MRKPKNRKLSFARNRASLRKWREETWAGQAAVARLTVMRMIRKVRRIHP